MGQTVSKKTHDPVKMHECVALVKATPNTNYSLTFTGGITLRSSLKKKYNHEDIYEDIVKHNYWNVFIQEVMRNSILSLLHKQIKEDFHSTEYPPISDIVVILDRRKKDSQNIVSGTIFWKSVFIDPSIIAECIADKFLLMGSSNKIYDSQKSWSYTFIPEKLEH